MFNVQIFWEVEGLCGALFVVVALCVKGISCRVEMGKIPTFFIGGSSCFCRIVATIDDGRKMPL